MQWYGAADADAKKGPRQSPKLTFAGQLPGLGRPFSFSSTFTRHSVLSPASLLAVTTPAESTLPPGPTYIVPSNLPLAPALQWSMSSPCLPRTEAILSE